MLKNINRSWLGLLLLLTLLTPLPLHAKTNLNLFGDQLLVYLNNVPEQWRMSRAFDVNLPLTRVDINIDDRIHRRIDAPNAKTPISIPAHELLKAYGHGMHQIRYVQVTYYYRGFGKVVEYGSLSPRSSASRLDASSPTTFRVSRLGLVNPGQVEFEFTARG